MCLQLNRQLAESAITQSVSEAYLESTDKWGDCIREFGGDRTKTIPVLGQALTDTLVLLGRVGYVEYHSKRVGVLRAKCCCLVVFVHSGAGEPKDIIESRFDTCSVNSIGSRKVIVQVRCEF